MSRFISKEGTLFSTDKYGIGFHVFDQWKKQMYNCWSIQPIEIGFSIYNGATTVRLKLLGFCIEIFIRYEESDIPF